MYSSVAPCFDPPRMSGKLLRRSVEEAKEGKEEIKKEIKEKGIAEVDNVGKAVTCDLRILWTLGWRLDREVKTSSN